MYSKVIKGFEWQTESYRIEPYPVGGTAKEDEEAEDDGADEDFDEDFYDEDDDSPIDREKLKTMMAEIAAKEQRAIDALKEAEVKAAIVKEESEAAADSVLKAAKEEAELIKMTAEQEADSTRTTAKEDAEKLKNDTQKECNAVKEAAKKEGHDEGYKVGHDEGFKNGHDEGLKKAAEEMKSRQEESVNNARHVVETAKEAAQDYLVKAEQDFAEIIIHAVNKVIPQHFIDVPQVILPAVKHALLKVRDQKEIKVHVAPAGYDLVLMARDEFRTLLTGGNAELEIIPDESLEAGDCLIETESGGVDARLSTQLKNVEEAVRSVLSKQG